VGGASLIVGLTTLAPSIGVIPVTAKNDRHHIAKLQKGIF
jgi:hypothetical protein